MSAISSKLQLILAARPACKYLGTKTTRPLTANKLLLPRSVPISTSSVVWSSSLPTPPPITRLPDPNSEEGSDKGKAAEISETLQRVRQWLDKFKQLDAGMLREAKGIEMSFSRSSGPGGQNVNKVNTKATVRCALDAPWIPAWAKSSLVKDPHYTASSHSILVTSTTTRSQAQNIDDCLSKLRNIILAASTENLKNATPAEIKKRVEGHVKADKARKRLEKEKRSSVKKGRSGGYDF
ncbi:hypothetical protein D9611_001301 [Ephemerocybe angulata]|uniref:Prokaryotic-type class I peptide chain release factors domain-containing protein n=1 Tax=Ephemerocybe angulata TaxID=980116 RepID=A0A8H5CJV0_9AGAR|nr:hypothetical protein D9611_001301 [Tulosesus angulatus]